MPLKRRTCKHRVFDDYHREQLLEGPDSCLLAGTGYQHGRVSWFRDMDANEQAHVLAEMEADWRVHGPRLMEWWNKGENAGTGGVKPWTFVVARGPDELPWAAREFGLPRELG